MNKKYKAFITFRSKSNLAIYHGRLYIFYAVFTQPFQKITQKDFGNVTKNRRLNIGGDL